MWPSRLINAIRTVREHYQTSVFVQYLATRIEAANADQDRHGLVVINLDRTTTKTATRLYADRRIAHCGRAAAR